MAIPQFLEYLKFEKKYSENTLTAYKNDLSSFSEYLIKEFGQNELEKVHYSQIRSWIVVLVEKGISNRSINRKVSSLKSYYKFLQKTHQLEVSPLAKHQALKTSKKIQIPFSENEVEDALFGFQPESFEDFRDKLIIELFYSTGIRRMELIEIKLNDIDTGNKLLKVSGKGNKERYIPLLDSVLETLELYLVARAKIQKPTSEAYLFLTSKGVKIYGTLVYRIINSYFSSVSSKIKRSPHILRHSFATHLLNQGATLNAIKELLGHSSLAATQVYTQNSIAELNKVYKSAHPRNRKSEL